jgi:hypothetical protein
MWSETLRKYSDPDRVLRNAQKHLGQDVQIMESTRKDKKFMVFHDNKWIHFGMKGYVDFSKSQDRTQLQKFQSRNRRFKDAPKWTPSYLSYYLLWE